jgi:photosystem II stability/assembly factor-like uncharacterized protein
LVEDPRDPNGLTLAATYGLVTTKDRGRSWYHVCEASFAGSDSYIGDPLTEVAGDGSLWVGVQTTLNVSRDLGCSWSTVLGGPADSVPDFTLIKQAPSSVLALQALLEDSSVAVHLTESTDNGATFNTVGTPLPVFNAFTIEVAPSDPAIIYVSGKSASGVSQLLASTDHGTTWTTHDLPSTAFEEIPYIAAVHPTDPKKIFVRTDARVNQGVTYVAGDALLYSNDGGKTWAELYRTGAKLLGFALSPDASTVLIGYGNPRDPELQVDDSVTGVYKSATASFAFARIDAEAVTCLSWTRTGVYVCTAQAQKGYALGFSPDSSFGDGAANLQPLLNLADIVGPLCCGGTQAVCGANWATSCALFGACRDAAGNAPPTCSSDGGTGGTAETGPASEEPAGVESGADGGRNASSDGGCGCRACGSLPGQRRGLLAGLLVLLALRSRSYGHGNEPK